MKPSEPEYIAIGRILSPWGTEGQIKVDSTTDFPQRYAVSSSVFVNKHQAVIESVEWHKGKAVIKLDIINDLKESQKLQGQFLEIHRSQVRSLPEGQYYHFQLVGLKVWTTGEELLGEITDILTASGNDTYVIKGRDGDILIPAAEDIIKSVNLKKKKLVIEPIKGLLELNKKAAR
ncbi:MAG: ribosome maturation factor RimM [Dehalococcoidales bacterium]